MENVKEFETDHISDHSGENFAIETARDQTADSDKFGSVTSLLFDIFNDEGSRAVRLIDDTTYKISDDSELRFTVLTSSENDLPTELDEVEEKPMDDHENGIQRATWKLTPIDLVSTPILTSIISRKSILSTGGNPVRPVAFSTPLMNALDETFLINSSDDILYENSQLSHIFSTPSTASTIDDSIIYYGAPMPGTPFEHRRAVFRQAFTSKSDYSTPSCARIHDLPSNSNSFDPKFTSTADGSELPLITSPEQLQ